MNALLRKEDLEINPTPRVPICLCLDVSSSMGRIVGGQTHDTGRREFRDGKWWRIVKGGVTALQEMIEGVNLFYDNLLEDDVARYAAEICVVTFGDNAELIMDFANLDRQEEERQQKISALKAKGETAMGEAVNMALDCLEARKQEYKDAGVDYYQPWLVLMTDGEPNGSESELNRAIARTNDLASHRKLTIFPIGIGDEADMQCLKKFSPRRPPLKLKGMNFKEFFEWLSASVSRTSQSMPGDVVKLDLDGIKTWGEL
ncbi:MAG: VWA domain-containing protein [Quinella sp. 1Q7]|nr:VWA domain-containing protein [Quinella sp. 1Q7]